MNKPCYFTAGTLLLAVLACRESPTSPTESTPALPEASVSAAAILSFREISAGQVHSCGVTTTNRAYCWGDNDFGHLGTGSNTGPEQCEGAVGPFPCSREPILVTGGHQFRQVSVGPFHACGVTTDNRAFCWGGGGRLGDGTTTDRSAPVLVAGGHQFRQVDAGYDHSCGVTTDDRAYCWGSNSFGQLGDGTTTQRLKPVAVAGGLRFQTVTVNIWLQEFSCGVTTDKRAFCWGSNKNGQLGDSSTASRRVRPTLVTGNRRFRQVDAGGSHACGITTGSRAFCWGNGENGELGNGKTVLSRWPRAVAGGLTFAGLTAGNEHTCGVATDNRSYCWGSNAFGKLGDGTKTRRLTPALVAGGLGFAQLGAGDVHTCGTTTSGKGYCWGDGFFGQLGTGKSGSDAEASTPTAVVAPL